MGDGVPRDAGRAVRFFERAAEQGDARAQCNLGAMYAQGIGVDQDYAEARRWYEKSAEQDNPDGQYNLAVVYAQALGGCKRDMAKARALCEKAAAQGQEKAQALLQSLSAPPPAAQPTPARAPGVGMTGAGDRAGRAQPEMGVTAGQGRRMQEGTAETQPDCQPLRSHEQGTATTAGRRTDSMSASDAPVQPTDCRRVSFGSGQSLELQGPGGHRWQGEEAEARFPKPGPGAGYRRLHLLRGLASEEEVAGILHVAQTSLEFNIDNDSVDQRPTFERYVVQVGQYIHEGLECFLRPIVEERLLPYVRRKFSAPDAVVCTALLRRYLPDERRVHPTHLDGHALCTAVLGLNAGEFEGGIYVQPQPDMRQREFLDLGRGDLAVHQYDLPHGVRVFRGRRYSLIFWIKDCMHSCVTNDTPWYDAAAAAGDPDAMTALAQKLNRGMNRDGVGSNPPRAAELYAKAAEMGQAEAQTNLGVLYQTGRGGLPADGAEAVRWWRRAAEAGDSGAQRLLALAYAGGTCGLVQSQEEAVRWMTLAAEQDDWEAMHWLSMYYGPGVHEDLDKALRWLRRAAEMGHPEAQYGLGSAHLAGEGVEESMELAAVWFRRAASNGNASAQCNLGAFYAQGLGGLQQDFEQALRWYQASADQGNPDGQHNMALMHAQGLGGLEQDFQRAREWGEKAAAQGHAKAIMMLQALEEEERVHGRVEELGDADRVEDLDDADRVEDLDELEELDEPGEPRPLGPAPGSSNGFAQEASLLRKSVEVRELLVDLRGWNESEEKTCSLLDSLLARVDALCLPTAAAGVPLGGAQGCRAGRPDDRPAPAAAAWDGPGEPERID